MKERISITEIVKSKYREKLIVYKATSTKDEIRFYLNDKQYIVASKTEDGKFLVSCEAIQETKEGRESKEEKQKGRRKRIKIQFFLALLKIIVVIGFGLLILPPLAMPENAFAVLLLIILFSFLCEIVEVLTKEWMTPRALKSKHSAEHMMINFLEKEERLPQNMEEIKKTSRFSLECGCRKKTKRTTELLARDICALGISGSMLPWIAKTEEQIIPYLLAVYFIGGVILGIIQEKYHLLDFLINPIQKFLMLLMQCCNTTRKVQEDDIEIAYFAAKEWMKVVYPEFYDEANL